MQRDLFDLGEQFGLHVAQADALLFDFCFGWDIRQVVVRLDEGADFAQRPQPVSGAEHVIRPAGVGDDDILGANIPVHSLRPLMKTSLGLEMEPLIR